jgi:glycosyltransferase involved in cell wall biosynthesis
MSKIGIIVLAFNEVNSLARTITELQSFLKRESYEIIISTSRQATQPCQSMAKELAQKFDNVKCHFQVKPYVAAAVLEPLLILDCEFIVYMSADGETPVEAIPRMLVEQKVKNADIVSASRWIKGGSFSGYGRLKYAASFLVQKICRIVYRSSLTEFSYGFRLYKSSILSNHKFLEIRHPFFLETLLVPLRFGYKICEIPVEWKPRVEGKTVVSLPILISYLRPLIKTRIRPLASMVK